jgi:hypothetical protein
MTAWLPKGARVGARASRRKGAREGRERERGRLGRTRLAPDDDRATVKGSRGR